MATYIRIERRPGEDWDGSDKLFTKDCPRCEWYRKIGRQDLCGWGKAFKYLFKVEKPRKCEVRNRKFESWKHSVEYLDEIIEKHNKE